jgi:hypothetical protein
MEQSVGISASVGIAAPCFAANVTGWLLKPSQNLRPRVLMSFWSALYYYDTRTIELTGYLWRLLVVGNVGRMCRRNMTVFVLVRCNVRHSGTVSSVFGVLCPEGCGRAQVALCRNVLRVTCSWDW